MAIEAEALRSSEETKASAWRPMKDAPKGFPIVAKHKPNSAMPHGWIATILLGHGDEDEPGSLDTILHYNGTSIYGVFHGCWDGWMPLEEVGSLIHRSALAEDTARAAEDGRWHVTARDGKPRYNGEGEQWLQTWSEASATYDIACIDGDWSYGQEVTLLGMDAWRWLAPWPDVLAPALPLDKEAAR
ncbi:hypothetical protein [Methylobacterium sp. CM6247]